MYWSPESHNSGLCGSDYIFDKMREIKAQQGAAPDHQSVGDLRVLFC